MQEAEILRFFGRLQFTIFGWLQYTIFGLHPLGCCQYLGSMRMKVMMMFFFDTNYDDFCGGNRDDYRGGHGDDFCNVGS